MTRATSAIRVLPAPDSAPPYEDEGMPAADATNSGDSTAQPYGVQGTLALSFSLPSGVPATPQPPPELRVVRSEPDGTQSRREPPGEPPEGDRKGSQGSSNGLSRADPPVRPWACKFVQALVEVLAGARPVSQLLQWTSPDVYDRVRRRAGVPGGWPPESRAPGRPRVHSVRLHQPEAHITEVCAVVRGGGRARAMALRLEAAGRHWRCTALELG